MLQKTFYNTMLIIKSVTKNIFRKAYSINIATITCFINILLSFNSCLATNKQELVEFTPQYINQTEVNTVLAPLFIDSDWTKQQLPYHACPGYYKKPSIPLVNIPEVSADSFEVSKNGISILSGNILYLDSKQKVTADKALVKRDQQINKFTELLAVGNIEYLNNEMRLVSNEIHLNMLNNTAYLNTPIHFRYYPRNARGKADKAELVKDQKYTIYNSTYTTCPPSEEDWILNAEQISIDPQKQIGTAKNTTLYFYDIPVFYSPYLRFPTSTQRESGFLMPMYSSSSLFGYSLSTPIYLNLAPNYDATLFPRYMTKRGTQIGLETRHLNKYGYNQVNLEYLPYDKEFENFRNNKLTTPPPGILYNDPRLSDLRHAKHQRYIFKMQDQRQITPYVTTNINYTRLSDSQYFIDLPSASILRQQTEGHLLQQAKANVNYHNWRGQALVQGFQTIHTIDGPDLTEPYRVLPSFSLQNNHVLLLNSHETNIPGPLVFAFDSHATRFASPANPKANKLAEGQRYYFKPSIGVPLRKTYGYIHPKIAANMRYYDLNRLSPSAQANNYDTNQSYFIPIYSVDSGLYLDKYFSLLNYPLVHTIEPRVFYLNIPKHDQNKAPDFDVKNNTINFEQLFRDNEFSGYDRQSNANQVTAGLISRLQNATNGREYAKLQLGQSFYFENKATTICDHDIDMMCLDNEIPDRNNRYSPFIALANIYLDNLFNNYSSLYGQAEWQWDYYLNTTKRINFSLHYLQQRADIESPQTIVNLEYNFFKRGNIQKDIHGNEIFRYNSKNHDLSEIEGSVKLPVHRNVVLLGFYSYDLQNLASLDRYFGVELQNCCWAVRFGYRGQLRLRTNSEAPKKYDSIFTVQFSLKGLGELNQGFERVLRNNITGYKNQLDKIY